MKSKNINDVAKKAGIWYTIGNILLKGCVFLSLPIFTRLLSTGDFGIYNAYMAYEGILTAILGLGLYGTVKNAKLDFKENFDNYISSILSFSITFLVFALVVANGFFEFYKDIIGFDRFVINCLILQSFGSYLIYLYGAKLNIEFKYKSYLVLSFFNIIGNIVASILLILYVFPNQHYLGRILGSALPLILIAIIISIYIVFKGKTFIKKKYLKYALAIGLPLVPHVISQSLLSQFDRILIKDIIGDSQSGIYSYIYTICTITYIILSSMDNAWTPWVYMKLKDRKDDEIKNVSNQYVKLFSIITILFICFIPEVAKIVADKEYWVGIDMVVPLAFANFFIFLYMLPVGLEYYNKKTAFISVGTVLAAALNFILNIIFIKKFGYKAAAYTTLFSYFALFIFHWIIARKYMVHKLYDLKYIFKTILVIAVASALVLLTNYNYILSIVVRYLIIIIMLFMLYKYKDFVLKMFKGDQNGKSKE